MAGIATRKDVLPAGHRAGRRALNLLRRTVVTCAAGLVLVGSAACRPAASEPAPGESPRGGQQARPQVPPAPPLPPGVSGEPPDGQYPFRPGQPGMRAADQVPPGR